MKLSQVTKSSPPFLLQRAHHHHHQATPQAMDSPGLDDFAQMGLIDDLLTE